jgi:hypothetical protein
VTLIWHWLATMWLTSFVFGLGIAAMAVGDWLVTAGFGILIGMLLGYLALWNMGVF